MSAERAVPQGSERQNGSGDDRPEFADRIGSVVGGYVLEEVVGSGGMGVVYRARHGETGRVVALKLMLPEVASNQRFRERFILEAQVAPQLDHPHIVPVFEVGESRGQLFIAMRLVDGPDLKEVIEREGALGVDRALRLIRQAAAALDHAHECGMVHRDVKPQNFLLAKGDGEEQHVYLTDFGLVKPTSTESTASRTTDVFGSIQYMSPEQIEAMPIDGRADVYSLACVAFECLTGRAPFERPNEISLLWAHVHEEPPRPTDVVTSLPGGLDLVLRQAMSKHPDDRYLTCGEFVDALEEGAKQHRRQLVAPVMRPLVKRIPRPKTEREVWAPNFFPELSRVRKLTERTNWVQVTAVTAVLMLLAAGFVQFSYEGGLVQAAGDATNSISEMGSDLIDVVAPDDEAVEPSVSLVDRTPGATEPNEHRSTRNPTLHDPGADGQRVSNAPLTGPRAGPIDPPSSSARVPAIPKVVWARTAGAEFHTSDIWSMNGDGTQSIRLTRTPQDEWWPDWSPAGTRIAYTRGGDVWVMKADGTGQRNLDICPSTGTSLCADPDWSPDGRKILFAREGGVYVADLRAGTRTRLLGLEAGRATGPGPVGSASWSPDGRHVVGACAREGHICVADVRRPAQATVIYQQPSTWTYGFAWSPNGDRIALTYDRDLYVMSSDGSTMTRLVDAPAGLDMGEPTWSDDGRLLAYVGWELPNELFTVSPDGGLSERLTMAPDVHDLMPDWWGPSS